MDDSLGDSGCDSKNLLAFAESLIHAKTDTYCSELQRRILDAVLQAERKTYDQLAEECGYSAKYVKQDVAPKLWQLFSQILQQKVTKSNVRAALERAMRRSASVQPARLPEVPTASVHPRGNILLVDDRPKNLKLLSDLLEEQGYEVQQAINGSVALQAIALELPDLILLDIHMPDMDGYLVCQRLKADPATRDIPVIFVSAVDEAWDKVKAFSVGGSDYIPKPFKVVEVLARVEHQMKIQQLQRTLKAQNAQLQQAIRELQRLAVLDEVAQVANRRRFDQYLLECWQRAIQTQTPLALVLAQLDRFDAGSERGELASSDRLLRQVAQAIQKVVQQPEALVARYGTLTFAIVLPGQRADGGKPLAQQLLEQVQKWQQLGALPALTLSIGSLSVLPEASMGIEEFVEGCDRNLQQARRQRGSRAVST